MNSSVTLNKSEPSEGSSVMEFSIRVPKNQKKKFNIMRFASNLGMDFGNWTQVKMERENNKGEKSPTKEIPKYGAGSEYRKEEKEEARRRKFGLSGKRSNVNEQPWILKVGGKNGKKFRGVRGGGVNDNASYYVFMHGNGNIIEAHPVPDWFNFTPFQRFKTLSAEEAEQEYGKRNKNLAYLQSLMRKRLHKEDDEEVEEEGKRKGRKTKDFKISEMDDWLDSDDDDSNDDKEAKGDDDDDDLDDKKKKKVKKQSEEKKKKVVNDDESAVEESDDGDEEGRELDYISDSSESVSDVEAKVDNEMKSVAEESGLRKLLTSDEEEEEETEEQQKADEETEKTEDNEKSKEEDSSQSAQQKKPAKRKLSPSPNKTVKNNGGDLIIPDVSSDSSDDAADWDMDKIHTSTSSESQTNYKPPIKKQLMDSYSSDNGISEEAIRRYLTRKPMTTTELLQKFKKSKNNLSSDQLVNTMTQILKKINPVKQTIKDKMYLSLKSDHSSSS